MRPHYLSTFALASGTEATAVFLPMQGEGKAVVEDYLATSLTLQRHLLALLWLQSAPEALGCNYVRQMSLADKVMVIGAGDQPHEEARR